MTEVILWQNLKGCALGVRFSRQIPVLDFVLDFYCKELKLAIEIDGATHLEEETALNDKRRQEHLEENGVTVLRYADGDVRFRLENVLEGIKAQVENMKSGQAFAKEL